MFLQLLLVSAEGNSTIVCFSRVQRMLSPISTEKNLSEMRNVSREKPSAHAH